MNSIQVHLFGKFHAQTVPGTDVEFGSSKAKELFCYLLLNQVHSHSREVLMNLLWNDTDVIHSRRYLRKTLWQLQSAIESCLEEQSAPLLFIESEWVQVNQKANCWIDAAIFEGAYNQVRGFHGSQLDTSQVRVLETAVELYQGDLLEGWYQEWCIYERERFQRVQILILDKLVESAEFHNQQEQGIYYANRILRCDQARERTHRCLMRLYSSAGDRTTALRQYEKCSTVLDKELGVTPGARTKYLYDQIRSGTRTKYLSRATVNHPADSLQSLLPEVLDHLSSAQVAINSIQDLLQEKNNPIR